MINRETLKIVGKDLIIGGVSASKLVTDYGTPLFVFDKKYILDMCKMYSNSLKKYYGDSLALYASKAFSAKGIYNLVDSEGLGCDVVSVGEFYTALKAGFDVSRIFFHGNNKTLNELNFTIENNIGYIVIDSFSEADDIDKICKKLGKIQKVLIRVNPGIEAHTHHYIQTATTDSKFGFSIENGDALEIIKHVISKKNLKLCGLHCHIGSQIFESKSFIVAVDKMAEFYFNIKQNLNYDFEIINLGGGIGIHYSEFDPYLSLSDYDNFVKIICEELKLKINQYKLKKPKLIIEPGRSIVGEAGITLYKVGRIKIIKNIKNYLAIDGGMFENPRHALYQATYEAIAANRANEKCSTYYTIAGKCCEGGDVITENAFLPEMHEGDIVAVLSTGAYNYSMASNYNRNLIPPVVMVENGKADYIVKPQTLDDLIRNDL